jgi:quercetin dioxygenase-like cupin family protein
MQKILFAAALLLPCPVLAQPAAAPPTKLFASSANVQALAAKAKAEHKTGNTVELVVNDEGYPFQLEYRTDTTPPSVHPKHAELIEVIEGSCTLVTGGKMIGLKPAVTPGDMTQGGTAIEGGSKQHIAKGDYILVPANTPHQYTEVKGLMMMTLHMPVAGK